MIRKNHFSFSCLCFLALLMGTLSGCKEEIDTRNRYTFVGETAYTYLKTNEDVFSSFLYILDRAKMTGLMKAYGTYTVFAPTNEAVERYLVEQDSIWRYSVDKSGKERWTGITSPILEELSDSMCDVIAKTHIIAKTYASYDLSGDVVPTTNLNDRYLTLRASVDKESHSILYVSGSRMISPNHQVENGYVHVMEDVLRLSSRTVDAEIGEMDFLSMFYLALQTTGLDKKLSPYLDASYTDGDKRLMMHHATEGDINTPYPASRYFGFTALCEPDEVYNEAGIYTLDDLYKRCQEWYPEATDPDFTSENNALWHFVAYHLLNAKLPYSRMVCYKIICGTICNSELVYAANADRFDYYETFQGTLVKMIRPLSSEVYGICRDGVERPFKQCILLNYCPHYISEKDPFNTQCGAQQIPVNIRVWDPTEIDLTQYPNFSQEALNGSIHLIDHLLIYNEDVMAGHVLNEPIRIDMGTMLPELINNHIRWSDSPDETGYQFIPPGFCSRIKQSNETYFFYGYPHNGWPCRGGDTYFSNGMVDISWRLPHVPPGTYEVRVSYLDGSMRTITQFYLDDMVCGIPVDMRLSATNPRVGWIMDGDTQDNGVANDKAMKNRGYLKGETTRICYQTTTARNNPGVLRYVLCTKYLDRGDHWYRTKSVDPMSDGRPMIENDFVELVPVGWLRNEGISLEEKRR